MIAANEVVARMLETRRVSSIRRVVKTPEALGSHCRTRARRSGGTLPAAPDSKALNEFLIARKAADPDHFADLSLAVIKLMGPGRIRPRTPRRSRRRDTSAWRCEDYTHSTAPNRRFADLVTQRLVKAVLADQPAPYTDDELAAHRATTAR